jgi:hypothetical protein
MVLKLIEYENGGMVGIYSIVDKTASDFKHVLACCEYFAQQGKKALITPGFVVDTIGNPLYEQIYASLKGTPYWGKCPDFSVDGLWYEHEGYDITKDLSNTSKRADSFSLMMKRGVKQSDRIILEDCGVGRSYIKRNIYNRIHFENQNISEVYVRTSDGLELLYKK